MTIRRVVPGEDIKAADHNDLATAIGSPTSGHAHTGATDDGKQVDHASLLNNGTHLHSVLDNHVDATQGTAIHAVHGLATGRYVPGMLGAQKIVACGSFTFARQEFTTGNKDGYIVEDRNPDWVSKVVTTGLTSVEGFMSLIDQQNGEYRYISATPVIFKGGRTISFAMGAATFTLALAAGEVWVSYSIGYTGGSVPLNLPIAYWWAWGS